MDESQAAAAGAMAEAAASGAGFADLGTILTALAVLLLLCLSAFFSGSETALTAASRAQLRRLADGDGPGGRSAAKGAATALELREDQERLIGGILLGNNLANVLATSLATSVLLVLFGESGIALATLAMTALITIFAEVLPKTYAITRPEAAASRVSRPIALFVRMFYPVVALVRSLVRGVLALFGVETDPDARVLAQDEIRGAIDLHHAEGAVERDQRDRLLGALELDEREVAQIMIHRRKIFMLDAALSPETILQRSLASPYTRIPLYREDPENIVGVIHAKDLLRAVDSAQRAEAADAPPGGGVAKLDIMAVAMEPWFVPDTTSLADQLRAFLSRKSHFAIVVDEYGALQGLVTLEDILEEIVGEISDEHDDEVEGVTREADGSITSEGAIAIRDLNRLYDWKLPEDEATTIAGLVIHEAQTIPTQGQIFIFHGFRFEILERRRHQITKLRMRPVQQAAAPAA